MMANKMKANKKKKGKNGLLIRLASSLMPGRFDIRITSARMYPFLIMVAIIILSLLMIGFAYAGPFDSPPPDDSSSENAGSPFDKPPPERPAKKGWDIFAFVANAENFFSGNVFANVLTFIFNNIDSIWGILAIVGIVALLKLIFGGGLITSGILFSTVSFLIIGWHDATDAQWFSWVYPNFFAGLLAVFGNMFKNMFSMNHPTQTLILIAVVVVTVVISLTKKVLKNPFKFLGGLLKKLLKIKSDKGVMAMIGTGLLWLLNAIFFACKPEDLLLNRKEQLLRDIQHSRDWRRNAKMDGLIATEVARSYYSGGMTGKKFADEREEVFRNLAKDIKDMSEYAKFDGQRVVKGMKDDFELMYRGLIPVAVKMPPAETPPAE